MKSQPRHKPGQPLAIIFILLGALMLLLTCVALASAAAGGTVTSPTIAPGPALPAPPEATLGSLKTAPLWDEIQLLLTSPNNDNPARRPSFLPDPLPRLAVHRLDYNPLTGEPLRLDPDTGKISQDIPAYGVSSVNGSGQLVDVTGNAVASLPAPLNENNFLVSRSAAQALGKALFWDMQVGSDGVQACGSCHFHAGADDRVRNSLNPDHIGGDLTLQVAGPNQDLTGADFPFHRLDDITVPGEPALNPANVAGDANDIVSSVGISYRRFTDVPVGPAAFFTDSATGVSSLLPDLGSVEVDPYPVFQGLRRVPPRNAPSVYGAAFNYDNFWDGRAREEFNGGSVAGAADPYFHVFAGDGTSGSGLTPMADPQHPSSPVRIRLSSLASQATGPPLSDFEMSFSGRNWAKIGKRMLQAGVVPLANQLVAVDDSVLGPYSNQGGSSCPPGSTAAGKPGLCITYPSLIQAAFKPEYHASTAAHLNGAADAGDAFDGYSLTPAAGSASPSETNQFSQMEANFSLFFGLGVQLYEQLLIPDDTPFDRFMEANPEAALAAAVPGQTPPPQPAVTLTPEFSFNALIGLDFFQKSNLSGQNPAFKTDGCTACHSGPELSTHTISTVYSTMVPELAPIIQDSSRPARRPPTKVISGWMLAEAFAAPAPAAVEVENVNFIGAVLEEGVMNAFLDEGIYNSAVRPSADDAGAGANGLFGWPLSRAALALENLGGPGFMPGTPMSTFDPDLGPASLSLESRGGGLFGPTPAYQRWLTLGIGPRNPGLSPKPLVPLLPEYMAPWTANLPSGQAHPRLDELIGGPNTLTAPPAVPFGPNLDCVSGVTNNYPGGPSGFGPNCPNLISGIANDADLPLVGTWPVVNRVGRMGSMKVPQLRSVELTGPYFHNGGTLTLQQVVDFYARGGDFPATDAEHLDPAMANAGGSPELVDFLLTLTDDRVRYERAPFDHPELFVPIDGTAPDNTGGRPFLLAASTGGGATFRQLPAVGAGGAAGPLPAFMGLARTPVPGPANDQFDSAAPKRYFWNYYDSQLMRSWILMGNPAGNGPDLDFGLHIGGARMTLAGPGPVPGVVPPGTTLAYENPGISAGPAIASSRNQMPAIVSQRSLLGDSFEEIPGTDMEKQSRHFYWTWYDMQSPGFKNWIIINNPDARKIVNYEVRIGGAVTASGTIAAGGLIYHTFPGQMGGPVEVVADSPVLATQRVLMNNDTAFNEVPGIPQEELSTDYHWTWYDMQSPGFKDWLLIANPDPAKAVAYEIRIDGELMESGTIAAGDEIVPTFPGRMAGPVEVRASANVIASQRVIAGPSFEEVPGFPYSQLSTTYHWTWYDMTSGFRDWVLIANPMPFTVSYEVRLAGTVIDSGSLSPGATVTPTYSGRIGGPLEVRASRPVIVSQRVTRGGHFNEVLGMTLTAGNPAPPPELPPPVLPEAPAPAAFTQANR